MNYFLAILICVVVNIVLGFAWYGPLFGRIWMRACGITEKQFEKMKAEGKGMGPKDMLTVILTSITQALVLAAVLAWYQPATWWAGSLVGSLLWLGFTLPALVNIKLFENRPVELLRINSLYYLVSATIMGAILSFAV